MTNKELYLKMKCELGNKYCIGLHNSTKFTWNVKVNFDEMYGINDNVINEDIIISNILKKGLYIPDRCVGIKSTVTILDRITVDSFDYSYYQYLGSDKCYVVIVSIPKYVYLDGKKYFIENMINDVNVTNYLLFSTLLPKEFIYGYYIKNVKYQEKCLDSDDVFFECVFDGDLEFYSNDNFYGYMDDVKKEEFWIDYFKNNSVDVSLFSGRNVMYKIKRKCR